MANKRGTCSWGHPALTAKEIKSIVENAIPERLRPYYIGMDIMKNEHSEPFTEWNTDIEVDFKYPVVGITDSGRYAHGDIEGVIRDMELDLYIDEDSRDEMHQDWDEYHDDMPVLTIKATRRMIDWHKEY